MLGVDGLRGCPLVSLWLTHMDLLLLNGQPQNKMLAV